MKKFLALTLSLLMVLSCMTCMFTVSAAAEETSGWKSPAPWVSFEQIDAIPAVNGTVTQMKTAANQAIYTRVSLIPNAEYTYTMYIKNVKFDGSYNQFTIVSSLGSDELDFAKLSGSWADYKVTNASPNHVADGAVVAYNSYFMNLGATDYVGADGETWKKINISFTTGDATEYVVVMNSFALVDSSDNNVYFSDVSFEKVVLSSWKSGRAPQVVETEADGSDVIPYNNGPAYRIHTWPANQSIYATANLEANTTYNFTAYFKGNYAPTLAYGGKGTATDGKGDTWVVSAKAGFDDCRASNGTVSTDGTWLAFDDNDGYENLYKQDGKIDAYTNLDTWRKFSFNFTTGSDTKYYIILGIESATGNEGNVDFYMSDVSVKKFIGMFANAEGNGTATVSNEAPDQGEQVTFTATPYAGATFVGWYNGFDLVSENPVYTVTAESALTLTARFEGDVITFKSPASWVSFEQINATPAVNGPVMKMKTAANQALYTRVSLTPNTNYTYTMYIKNAKIEGYNQFTIVSSLGSDELDFAKLSGSWADYKVTNASPNHVADGAVVAYNSYFMNLGATDYVGADGETWKKINISFTTGDATEYVVVMNSFALVDSSDNNVYISDAEFVEEISMSADSDGNGTVSVSNPAPKKGEQVTFTATPYAGARFDGWYDGFYLVSEEPVYTVTAEASLSLTAYFDGDVIRDWKSPASWVSFEELDVTPAVNGPVIKMKTAASQAFYTRISLNPNTKYTYTMYLKNISLSGYTQFSIVSSLGDDALDFAKLSSGWRDYKNPDHIADGAVVAYNSYCKDIGVTDFVGADGESWQKLSVEFTTSDASQYVVVMNSATLIDSSDNSVYISDAAAIEFSYAVPEITEYSENLGSSLRKESESAYGQAIRHKYVFEKSLLTANYDGFKVVEIGFVTATTSAMEGYSEYPELGATDYKVITGIAYKADYNGNVSKNVVFAEDDTTVTYTAALYNIADYSKAYTVVPYAVFENATGEQVVRYGNAQAASIFDVAKAILEGDNQSDKDYVNNTLLAGDRKNQYDEWVK